MQGEHKYARRPNGAWTRRSASLYRPDKFRIRRRSCCDAPRHAFANLALKYQFATCIPVACRDTFLRTARLWQSSRGGTDQIYRGCARAKFARLILPVRFSQALACTPHLIRGAAPHPRRKNEAVRARDVKMQRRKIQQRSKRPSGAQNEPQK